MRRFSYVLTVRGFNGFRETTVYGSERKAKAAKRDWISQGFWCDYEIAAASSND